MSQMTIEQSASGFVGRAEVALNDLGRATETWADSARSNTHERRLHSMSVELDKAIRKVDGKFDAWASLKPEQVQVVAENGPIGLLWLLSAHPSGRVREAFVHATKHLPNDRVLPHMANRSIDPVREISQIASQIVKARLGEILVERAEPKDHGPLPTEAHISVDKLLTPRTAIVAPELIGTCIGLANTSTLHRPGRINAERLDRMLHRCHQTLASTSDPVSIEALETLSGYFTENVFVS